MKSIVGRFVLLFGGSLALLVSAGCGDSLPPDDREREKFGELYDLDKYKECKKKTPRNRACERYRLARNENPEYWPNPAVPKPKWPDPPKESVYKPGMKGVDYWRALCKAEAGEFIYKVVEDVEGIYQIRPRKAESSYALLDRNVLEDPYGHGIGDDGWRAFMWFVGNTAKFRDTFLFFERPIVEHDIWPNERKDWHPSMSAAAPPTAKYQFYFGYDSRSRKTMMLEYRSDLQSRYGFNWRGIDRPHDRAMGVSGGELMIVDLTTGEVLGLRRGFILGASNPKDGFFWTASSCPEYATMPGYGGRNRDGGSIMWFISKVLKSKVDPVFRIKSEK